MRQWMIGTNQILYFTVNTFLHKTNTLHSVPVKSGKPDSRTANIRLVSTFRRISGFGLTKLYDYHHTNGLDSTLWSCHPNHSFNTGMITLLPAVCGRQQRLRGRRLRTPQGHPRGCAKGNRAVFEAAKGYTAVLEPVPVPMITTPLPIRDDAFVLVGYLLQ